MMFLTFEMIKEAWISIHSYKLRSFLTILGIIIGIAAVVVMVAVGEGVQNSINEQFSGLGANQLIIRPGNKNTRGVTTGSVNTLTYEDSEAIDKLSFIKNAAYVKTMNEQVVANGKNKSTNIYGISEKYLEVNNNTIEKGRGFSDRDIKLGSPYAIIGSEVKEELFKNEDAIGQTIRIKNIPVKIIGVLKAKGAGFGGPSQDDIIMIPFKTFSQRLSSSKFPKSIDRIALNVADEKYMDYAEQKITELLRTRHKLKKSDEDDFRVMNLEALSSTVQETANMFSILLASIASISLLVGSIGIMNMMLVSVTERTREIGLRKSIGAKEGTIMQQFLFEAMLISFIGSMIGLGIGLGLSRLGKPLFDLELPVSVDAIVLSLFVSVIVGIGSGLFPAIKASKLNPIDALRYE